MRAAYDKYQAEGFVVLSVSVQENNAVVDDFIAKYDLAYPFVLDLDGRTSNSYRVFTTPTTYFVHPDGVITDILPGVMNESWIDRNMAAVTG